MVCPTHLRIDTPCIAHAFPGIVKSMAQTFGFSQDEIKLLLVAVRQMRRTFAQPRRQDASLESYAALYDALYEKLHDMAGPLPEKLNEDLES